MHTISLELLSTWLGLGVLAFEAICVSALVWVHFLPTGQYPIRDAVSNYGAGTYRAWYRTAALALGIAGLLLAVAVILDVRPVPVPVVLLLVLFGIARLLIGWFPTDLEPAAPTRTGRIHMVLAVIAFASLPIAAGMFSRSVRSLPEWTAAYPFVNSFARALIVVVLVMVMTMLVPRLRLFFGLLERLLYISMIGWIAVVALFLSRALKG